MQSKKKKRSETKQSTFKSTEHKYERKILLKKIPVKKKKKDLGSFFLPDGLLSTQMLPCLVTSNSELATLASVYSNHGNLIPESNSSWNMFVAH